MNTKINLYGTERCHKTQYYRQFLENLDLEFQYFDVEANENYALELRSLYTNKKLNFPTITINSKKLRNPSDKDLLKWLTKNDAI